ncbi:MULTISPECIES: copper homeostasis protein CutC [Lactococcus]|jgi:copper homeostasis protein|uniref:copper homeostasis protein CutC n=1 Tax=Lactococcus TaxID=1357 RepID=UPI00024D9227|nr:MULTISPECIES: copper homeostasis protein CutC [Lactococcus]MCA2381900.1 copper homeostasis protein CutC [Lactococcus sp. SK2-659]MCI2094421.1 copper homeostasis protein CutC [Lactococcus lactis]MCI2139251.1 copper homeostasis protein CutC [Lactococcus lactis]MCI2188739.1 copper homeostasis protein CutC [Lactococcus lactis]THA53697.1 copper homeostasis protein CutC [Lactococcus lactis]
MIIRELCLENFTKIPQALQAGVERIELCDNLAVGGTTPSYGVIEEAAKYVAESKTTLAVMIRPRGGNFVYNSHELKIIETDTLKAVEAGAQNIVFGALTPDNEIDTDALETVSIAAQGLPITFHMAFDEVTDQEKAIDQLVEFGVDKILTHGGPLDQPLNTDKLKSLIDYAKGKINIIIGGGVNAENFENLAQLTRTNYVHGTKIIKL